MAVFVTMMAACGSHRSQAQPRDAVADEPSAHPAVRAVPPPAADDASVGRKQGATTRCEGVRAEPPTSELRGWPFRALPDLARDRVEPSGFDTEGVVAARFVPQPCPAGALCKPQPPPHIVLGERVQKPEHTLVLFTPDPSQFAVGSKASVSVALCGTSSYGGSVNEGSLVAFRP